MIRRSLFGLVAVAVVAAAFVELAVPQAFARDGDTRILLTGTGGSGSARSRTGNDRLELDVEAEHLKVAAGTMLTVNVDGKAAGTMTVTGSGSAELELRSDHRQTVPTIMTGSVVTVVDAAGNVLMTGTF
jgi:hypothetical protein